MLHFLGVSLPSQIVNAKAMQYASMRIYQLTAAISGCVRIAIAGDLQPATQHFRCGAMFYWDPQLNAPGNESSVKIGIIQATDFDSIIVSLLPISPLFIDT